MMRQSLSACNMSTQKCLSKVIDLLVVLRSKAKCFDWTYTNKSLLFYSDASTRFIEIRKRTNAFPKAGTLVKTFVAVPTTSGTGSEVSPFTGV